MAIAVLVVFPFSSNTTSAASAGKNYSGPVPIWRDKDSFQGCMSEIKETGTGGPICLDATLAVVPPGTKVRRMGGWLFIKIQLLEGPYTGMIGYVPMEDFSP